MKKTLTYLILLASLTSNGQDNWIPADNSSNWYGRILTSTGIEFVEQQFLHIQTETTDTDTIIADQTYTKLYKVAGSTSFYFCAFRADVDENALYMIPKNSSEEHLYFDYDMDYTIGDTVEIPYYSYVSEEHFKLTSFELIDIDSVLIDAEYYTYWSFDNPIATDGEAFGIQVMERMIGYNGFPFVGKGIFETQYELKCYTENDIDVYGTKCPFTRVVFDDAARIKSNRIDKVIIYPNPVINELTMQLSKNASLQIFNTQGKLLYTEKLNAGKSFINMTNLREGMYIYTLQYENSIETGQFVKN